jgi:transposase
MGAFRDVGRRIKQALTGSPGPAACPGCERLSQENLALRQQNEALSRANETLREEIARLRQLAQEAQRSAKRQAAPFSKGPPKEKPKRPGRKRGKAYGVKARRRIPDHFDESYHVALPSCCPYCQGRVAYRKTVDQYQEEIPKVKPIIRRFLNDLGTCERCHRPVRGRHPLQTSEAVGAAGVTVGPAALALSASLNKRYGVSFGKVCGILKTAFSLSISRGGVSQALDRIATALEPTHEAFIEYVRGSPVVCPDETGWKVGGRLHWLWAFATPQVTVYRIMDGRGYDEACQVLGADFHRTLVRDGWAPYRSFTQATHQTCIGGHIIRRCKELLATAQRGAARVPHAVLRILYRALALRDHWIEHPPTDRGRLTHAGIIVAEMDRLLSWTPTDNENRKLLKHLRIERNALFTFLYDPSVPASNYRGEQAIRPAVVTRKVWGGNRTLHGARTQGILGTYLRSCDQQGVDSGPPIVLVLRSPGPLIAPLPCFALGP